MLFYDAKEQERMGVKRVKMAAEAGANVVVTACPFCLVNIEDGIKVAGLEGKMSVIDLAELANQQIAKRNPATGNGQTAACHGKTSEHSPQHGETETGCVMRR